MIRDLNFILGANTKIPKGTKFTISGQFKKLTFKQWVKKLFGETPVREYQQFIVTEDCTSEGCFIPYEPLET